MINWQSLYYVENYHETTGTIVLKSICLSVYSISFKTMLNTEVSQRYEIIIQRV